MLRSKKRWRSSWPILTRMLMGELKCQRWADIEYSFFIFTLILSSKVRKKKQKIILKHYKYLNKALNFQFLDFVDVWFKTQTQLSKENPCVSLSSVLQLAQILPTEENFLLCFREFVGSSSQFMAVSLCNSHVYISIFFPPWWCLMSCQYITQYITILYLLCQTLTLIKIDSV